jgi:misacylated tRNA(Ala) deacylase
MNPNEGRLQTAEHILARTLENRFADARFVIAKFGENSGLMEIASKEDLRKIDVAALEDEVNSVIKKNLQVSKYILPRSDAEKEFDLARLPSSVCEVRIVEIKGFDKTPCKDPHVENTGEIGYFLFLKVERVGKDRYRFVFEVK